MRAFLILAQQMKYSSFFLAKQPGIYDSPGRPGNDEVFGNPSPWRLKISREMKIHPKLGGGFKYIYPYFLKIPILTIWLMFFRWVVQPPTRYPICFPMLVIGTSIPIFRWWKFPWDKSRIPAANFTEAHWIYWSPRFFFIPDTKRQDTIIAKQYEHTQPLMSLKPNIFRGVLASSWCHD